MPADRTALLKIIAGAAIGLFLFDKLILTPGLAAWKAQGERLAVLRENVERGRNLIEREASLRSRWEEMQRTDLAEDLSEAESAVFKAIGRWGRESRVSFSSLTPQWRTHEQGYDTFDCRATATGDQTALGRLLYEIETDALPARVEEVELSARDNKGQQLGLSLKFSFVSITGGGGKR
jgi:hypothetical protein